MNLSIASAVFDDENEADRAVSELRTAGVPDSALSIIAQEGRKTMTSDGTGTVTDESGGSVIRGLLGGGALGTGLGVAALAIPGVGPLVGLGAIAAAAVPEAMLIGGALGAAAGGLGEALTKHGISEDDAAYYGDRMKTGGTLVSGESTAPGVSSEQIREILYRHGGHNASQTRMAPAY